MRIGIDLGGTKIEGVVMEGAGVILERQRVPTPAGDYEATIDAVRDLVISLEKAVGATDWLNVGIGMPGSVSTKTGLVKNSNSTCLNGRPFREDAARVVKRPLTFSNDANCFALSEARDGHGRGHRTVFGVILGTGVGGGVVVDGFIVDGPNGIAGEWGHIPLPWPDEEERIGPECYCGRRGCVETWVSGPGFAREFERVTGRSLTGEQIVAAAQCGDLQARQALDRLTHRIGKSLAVVSDILDPDVIVLGGGLSNIDKIYVPIAAALRTYAFSDSMMTLIRPALHGDSSGVRGAAWLWPDE